MIRIDASDIGIKTPIRVNETIKKVKETFKYQSEVLTQSKPKGKSVVDQAVNYYDSQLKTIDEMLNYITDMLDLNASQAKKLQKANFSKVMSLSTQIVSKMLHYGDGDNDPKKGKKSRPRK